MMTNAQLEAAFLSAGCHAVTIAEWNGWRLVAVIDGGQIVCGMGRVHPDHGFMVGTPFTVRFVQQARQRFFAHAGHAEK